MPDEKVDKNTVENFLSLHSIDATQTAFADKGIAVSERTIYKWRDTMNNASPLMHVNDLVNEIQTHFKNHHASSEDDIPTRNSKWANWKRKLTSIVSLSYHCNNKKPT